MRKGRCDLKKRGGGPRACEPLEQRFLFTALLDIDANGALTYQQLAGGVASNLNVDASKSVGLYTFAESAETITLGSGAVAAGWTLSAGNTIARGPDSSVNSISIDTGDAVVAVQSTKAPVSINPSQGRNQIVGIGGDANGAQGIAAPLDVQNRNAFTKIIVNDAGDTSPQSYTINPTFIEGLTPGAITYGTGVTSLQLLDGSVDDQIVVTGTPQAAPDGSASGVQILTTAQTTVEVQAVSLGTTLDIKAGGAGAHDSVKLTNAGSVQGILGNVSIENSNSVSELTVDDSADPIPLSNPTLVTSVSGGKITDLAPGIITFDPLAIDSLTIDLGTANADELHVGQTVASSGALTTINGGIGNDTFFVDATPLSGLLLLRTRGVNDQINLEGGVNGLGGILGAMQLINLSGAPTLLINNDHSDSTPRSYVLTDSSFVGGGTSAPVNFANVGTVQLNASGQAAASAISVRPSPTTAFTILGNYRANPLPPGAVLNIDTTGSTGAALTYQSDATGLSGTYTFTNRQPVNFQRIGTVNPNIGSIVGKVFSGQTAAPIAGATVFVDLNQNGVLDAGEPTAVTDASGSYSFGDLTPGTYRVVEVPFTGAVAAQPSSGFANVTVVGGQQTAGINFEDVAAPVAIGPDLVASFFGSLPPAVISGASGKLKLRISNSGTAAAAGVPQIDLFASPDAHLDPGETPFATLSAGKLSLRPGASKILNLSFKYPAGIPDGAYFLVASLDPTNLIAETNKANNLAISTSPISIAAPLVDLTGAFGQPLPVSINGENHATVPVLVGNIGNTAASGSISVSLFASSDRTLDAGDPLLTKFTGQRLNLKPGKSQLLRLRAVAAGGLVHGSYFLIVFVNSDQTLAESMTANNISASASAVLIG